MPKTLARPVGELTLIYARISGQDDERTASLDSQVENCFAKAAALGAVVHPEDVHRERFTGYELYNRTVLVEVRAKVRSGRYSHLIVHAIDRLSRKMAHLAIVAEECDRHGVALVSATEDIDNTPEGELIRSVKAYVAEVEREKIRERTMRGRAMILAGGKHPCNGYAIFGYRYDKASRAVVIDPPAAELVRRIFAMAADGASTYEVARRLNAEGVPTPAAWRGHRYRDGRATRWINAVIHRIIRNDAYTGRPLAVGKTVNEGRRPNGRPNPVPVPPERWQHIESARPPRLVDDETFRRANATLDDGNTSANRTRSKDRPRLLRGMMRCGVCGLPMRPITINSEGRHYFYYRCSSKGTRGTPCGNRMIRCQQADDLAWAGLVGMVADPDAMRAGLDAAISGVGDAQARADIDALESVISKLERQQETLTRKWSHALDEGDEDFAGIVEGQLRKCVGELKAARAELELSRPRLDVAESKADILRRLDRVIGGMSEVGSAPDVDTFEEKRRLLEILGVVAVWNGRDLAFELPFELPSFYAVPCQSPRKTR